MRKESETSQKEKDCREREAGQEVKWAEFDYWSRETKGFRVKKFSLSVENHTLVEDKGFARTSTKKKCNYANFLYATVSSTFHYGTCCSLVHKISLEIFWPSCIFHGRKSADRVVPAKILSSGVCCLNHTASEKQNQQLQVLKDIF